MKERQVYSLRPGINNSKKSNKKNTGKIRQFARCFIHLFIPTVFNPILDGGGGANLPPPAGFFNIAQKPLDLGS